MDPPTMPPQAQATGWVMERNGLPSERLNREFSSTMDAAIDPKTTPALGFPNPAHHPNANPIMYQTHGEKRLNCRV